MLLEAGLRYTARALFHVLNEKYEKTPWPATEYKFVKAVDADTARTMKMEMGKIRDKIITRIDEADAPYQMVSTFGDGLVFVIIQAISATTGCMGYFLSIACDLGM